MMLSPRRAPLVCAASVALLFVFSAAGLRAREVVQFRDDFDDRTLTDGDPVAWIWRTNAGTFDADTGDFRICGGTSGLWALTNTALPGNDRVRAQVGFDSTVPCFAWVWARGNWDTGNMYLGVLASNGWLSIERYPADTNILAQGSMAVEADQDYLLQLDVRSEVRESVEGVVLELRAWKEGEEPPAEPLLEAWDPQPLPVGLPGLGMSIHQAGGYGCASFRYLEASGSEPKPEAEIAASPSSGAAPLDVELQALNVTATEGNEIVSLSWDLGDGTTAEGETVSHTYAEPGRYLVRLTLVDDRGVETEILVNILAHCSEGSTPSWQSADIGDVAYPGSAWVEGPEGDQEVQLCVGGKRFGSTEDDGFLLYRELTGDFRISARVLEIETSPLACQVGLISRAGLDPTAICLGTFLQQASGGEQRLRFSCRDTLGGSTALESGEWGPTTPTRICLQRKGDRFVASYYPEGGSPIQVQSGEIPGVPETLLVGVAACNSSPPDGQSAPAMHAQIVGLEVSQEDLPPWFRRGDVTGDGMDLSDAVAVLDYLFLGEYEPTCLDACDSNDDGELDISDPLFALGDLFLGGPPIPAPGPDGCGSDLTDDDPLGCEAYSACETESPAPGSPDV